MRRPFLLTKDTVPPPRTLIVDCSRTDGAATWSHWDGAPRPPTPWIADTATEQVLRALADDPTVFAGFDVVANDHIDADGLLSLACACIGPAVLPHADLLIAAAEAGDFTAWTGEAGLRLAWVLHRRIGQGGPGQGILDEVTASLDDLIVRSATAHGESFRHAAEVRARIQARDGFTVEKLGDLVSILWAGAGDHAWDQFNAVPTPTEPLPLWSCEGLWEGTCFHLHGEQVAGGIRYVAYAPFHSWAETVVRPRVARPDLGRCLLRLNGMETGGGHWVADADARRVAFTGILACVDVSGRPTPSALGPGTVAAALREALRHRRTGVRKSGGPEVTIPREPG